MNKVAVGGSLLALVGGLFLFGGKAKAGGRAPYLTPIPVPGRDAPMDTVDDALCFCAEADTPDVELARCVLLRLYPDVPWPARAGDHATVRTTERVVQVRAQRFIASIRNGERPCDPARPDIVGPGGEEPVAPGWDPVNPFADAPTLGAFAPIVQNSNPTRLVADALGVSQGATGIPAALRCMAGTGWNLYFYSRPIDQAYYAARVGQRFYDIGPAWLPINRSMRAAYDAGERPIRVISWSGKKIAGIDGANRYGSPWLPPMERSDDGNIVCPGGAADPWAPERNPPAEVLARLGHNLEAMRDAWEAGQQ